MKLPVKSSRKRKPRNKKQPILEEEITFYSPTLDLLLDEKNLLLFQVFIMSYL